MDDQFQTCAGKTDEPIAALVVDLPNMNCHLHALAGKDANKPVRLAFDALAEHLVTVAGTEAQCVATVFMQLKNRNQGTTGFILRVRQLGFGVYPRPVGDIDDNLVESVAEMSPMLQHLLLMTHDKELIERCEGELRSGARLSVLGLEEDSSLAIRNERIEFTDLGDIPGVLPRGLARQAIGQLPDTGKLLPPLRPLRSSGPTYEHAA